MGVIVWYSGWWYTRRVVLGWLGGTAVVGVHGLVRWYGGGGVVGW